MKCCCDCVHSRNENMFKLSAPPRLICTYPEPTGQRHTRVYGVTHRPIMDLCANQRDAVLGGDCGEDAERFRPTMWARIASWLSSLYNE